MPQPAFNVSPASCTLRRMSSMESWMVPDTVQLIVEVAGLWSQAPALEIMRPAGIAPWRSAHRNFSYQCSRNSGVASTSASARATRWNVPSMVSSSGRPSLAFNRYLVSQISQEAGCIGTSAAVVGRSAGCRCAVFMNQSPWRRYRKSGRRCGKFFGENRPR